MGFDKSILHAEHIASKLAPGERNRLEVQTASDAQRKWQTREERQIHEDVSAWLRLKQIPFVHGRMDKPSTIRKGWPDFTCLRFGRGCCVEVKAAGGLLSADQREVIAELAAAGVPCVVAISSKEAIDFIIATL